MTTGGDLRRTTKLIAAAAACGEAVIVESGTSQTGTVTFRLTG